jgi:AraC-like DNA-binding protein
VTVTDVRRTPECTISIRLLWLYARVASADPELIAALGNLGIGPREFTDLDTRLPHGPAMALLQSQIDRTGDKTLGLRAGSNFEHGDFDVLESAARSCANLGEAIRCISRYACLLNEACAIELREEGDDALWTFWLNDGVPHRPAGNDFAVACAFRFARMYADLPEGPVEVHFMHAEATDPAGYARLFGPNVKLGMPRNAVVFPRRVLAQPMRRAAAHLHIAFETRTKELVDRLRVHQGVAGRVRDVVLSQLRGGESSMNSVARALAMSPATLRRRLAAEGTTHTEILDQLRRELAKAYLVDPSLSTQEVAFLLGYAHAKAFYEAFRRWTGTTPADYRARSLRPSSGP